MNDRLQEITDFVDECFAIKQINSESKAEITYENSDVISLILFIFILFIKF